MTAKLVIDPNPCHLYPWTGQCDDVYSGSHACTLPGGHEGACECSCGQKAQHDQDLIAEARRLSTMVDRLERESLELLEALGLHEDTGHDDVLEHVRTLVREHGEMRMVVEGHRHGFEKHPGHHPKCDIPKSCQGGCWDLFCEDRP